MQMKIANSDEIYVTAVKAFYYMLRHGAPAGLMDDFRQITGALVIDTSFTVEDVKKIWAKEAR
jgi:hypothetical protein